jgi:hypothetical protein
MSLGDQAGFTLKAQAPISLHMPGALGFGQMTSEPETYEKRHLRITVFLKRRNLESRRNAPTGFSVFTLGFGTD